ncbi:MAG: hypothetical protein WCJ64_22915 [Rhodospirillaceae bacterium]
MSWTRRLGALALGAAALAALPALSTPARADEAAPRPAATAEAGGQRAVAVVTVVRTRDLITPAERQAYRQAIRAAKTPEERASIRRAAFERLAQRASEHGVVMIIDAPMRPGQRWSEREARPMIHPAPGR